jgi:hypothetical protein
MADRPVEEIRLEIAAEREALSTDLDALQAEARAVLPYAIGGLVVVAVLGREKRLRSGLRLLWKLL